MWSKLEQANQKQQSAAGLFTPITHTFHHTWTSLWWVWHGGMSLELQTCLFWQSCVKIRQRRHGNAATLSVTIITNLHLPDLENKLGRIQRRHLLMPAGRCDGINKVDFVMCPNKEGRYVFLTVNKSNKKTKTNNVLCLSVLSVFPTWSVDVIVIGSYCRHQCLKTNYKYIVSFFKGPVCRT